MIIRQAFESEYATLIYNETLSFDSDIITTEELAEYNTWVLVSPDSQIHGHYVSIDEADCSYLYSILINSSVRGKGYSKKLLEHFLSINDLKKTLHVDIFNAIGINLYKSYNFKIIEKHQNFYQNGRSAYLMERIHGDYLISNIRKSRNTRYTNK